jgi:hypothetical protein
MIFPESSWLLRIRLFFLLSHSTHQRSQSSEGSSLFLHFSPDALRDFFCVSGNFFLVLPFNHDPDQILRPRRTDQYPPVISQFLLNFFDECRHLGDPMRISLMAYSNVEQYLKEGGPDGRELRKPLVLPLHDRQQWSSDGRWPRPECRPFQIVSPYFLSPPRAPYEPGSSGLHRNIASAT